MDGWQRLAAAARQVEASAASVVVVGGGGGGGGLPRDALPNGPNVGEGEGEGEGEGAVAWARWWAEREARVVGALLHVARAHHRDERQQRVAHALDPAAAGAVDADADDELEREQQEEERALAALEASTRRAEELEEALFRRSEMRSRRVCLAAHLRALPHHLARLFPTTTSTSTTTSWAEEEQEEQEDHVRGREEQQRLREELQHRDQKVSSFLELHAELLQVERELEEARRARAAEEEVTRRLWRQAKPATRSRHDGGDGDQGKQQQQQREEEDDEGDDRMDEGEEARRVGRAMGRRTVAALQRADAENARLREVWQALILESGLNWAADEQLRDVLFRLQSPLAFLHAPGP